MCLYNENPLQFILYKKPLSELLYTNYQLLSTTNENLTYISHISYSYAINNDATRNTNERLVLHLVLHKSIHTCVVDMEMKNTEICKFFSDTHTVKMKVAQITMKTTIFLRSSLYVSIHETRENEEDKVTFL